VRLRHQTQLQSNKGLPHNDGRDWRLEREFESRDARGYLSGDWNRRTVAEQLVQGAEILARREAFLEHYEFRTRRERRIYELHVSGLSDEAIARRLRRSKKSVQVMINRVERSTYADALVPMPDGRVWHYWLQGWTPAQIAPRCRTTREYVGQVVEKVIREWRRTPPAEPQVFVSDVDPVFLAKLGDLTPDAVLEAAQRDPELAAMISRLEAHRRRG
jgi:hypothetical protein